MADEPTPTISIEPIAGSGEVPVAWQPFTPSGVAAFASATFGRVFVVQGIVALLGAATVVWFLATVWFPIVREGIRNLPAQGSIAHGEMNWPGEGYHVLVEQRPFLAFTVDLENHSQGNSGLDLTVRFRKKHSEVCSPFGMLTLPYDKQYLYEFNQPEVEPWWGAWQPILLGWSAILTAVGLLLSWTLFAALYFVPAWLLGFYGDRQLSWGGSWRLCSVALIPGALLCLAAVVLYGLRVLDLFHLLFAYAIHFVAGWSYVVTGVLKLPRVPQQKNPFQPPLPDNEVLAEAMASANPFAGPGEKVAGVETAGDSGGPKATSKPE